MLNLETCTQCQCVIDSNQRWGHENWHQLMRSHSTFITCTRCGVGVDDWGKHSQMHDELDLLKDLLNHLLGDVEAHLSFMAAHPDG